MKKRPPERGEARDERDEGGLMYVRCAYCGRWMDAKPGHLNMISHGLCSPCFEREMARIDEMAEENTGT